MKIPTSTHLCHISDPPAFSKPVYEIEIRLGDARVENLTARANPAGVWYSWVRDDAGAVQRDRWQPQEDSPLLALRDVGRSEAGWYRLTAGNSEGNATVTVHVNVLCECTTWPCGGEGGITRPSADKRARNGNSSESCSCYSLLTSLTSDTTLH